MQPSYLQNLSSKFSTEEKRFIPKKTGRDQGCQVDVTKLCNFDEQVRPIVMVIVTKTLEQSLWEAENELELEAMSKQKQEYFEQKEADMKEKQEVFVENEIDVVNEKYFMISKVCEEKKIDNMGLLGNEFVKETKIEVPEHNSAQLFLIEYKQKKKNFNIFLDAEKFKDWLMVKTEGFIEAEEKEEQEIRKVIFKMELRVNDKFQQALDLKFKEKEEF